MTNFFQDKQGSVKPTSRRREKRVKRSGKIEN
jgi:hypothetical protein